MNVDLYGDTFDFFCDHLTKKDAEVLDIACGPGNISRYLLNKRPDLKLLGIDLAPNMIDLARINNPEAEFRVMDCMDISSLDKKFDGIVFGFCFPYLSEEVCAKLIGDAAALLNKDGVLYISTMEENEENRSGIRTSSRGNQLYMYYHTEKHLSKAIEENHLRVLDLQRKVYPGSDGTKTTDLVIIAIKTA